MASVLNTQSDKQMQIQGVSVQRKRARAKAREAERGGEGTVVVHRRKMINFT